MHAFPREIHVLEASFDRDESLGKAKTEDVREGVERYFERRDKVLGRATHRVIDAFNVQTSDGYAVICDVTLLYSIADPVRIAKDFGWGSLYVDAFVVNTFRNGVLPDARQDERRVVLQRGAADRGGRRTPRRSCKARFAERGFKVETLLLRNYRYAENYEKSLQDKKVAVQLTEKNRKESARQRGEGQAGADRVEGERHHHDRRVGGERADREDPRRGRALRLADAGQGRQGGQRGAGRGQAAEGRRPDTARAGATSWRSRRPRCSRTSRGRS